MSSTSSSRTTVLIVGAGPVGLALALDLIRQGIAVRIVTADKGEPTSLHSRAIVMWPRSLELLRRVGVSEELAASGHHISAVKFFVDRRQLAAADLSQLPDTPYPFGLMIPQHRTERILREALVRAGGTVETEVKLVGLETSGGLPVARLRHASGTEEEVEADWLVGADGAHSTTRSLLGIEFPAQDNEVLFAIGDGTLEGGPSSDALIYSYSIAGALGLAPLGDRMFRIAFAVPRWDREDGPEPALFQKQVDQLSPGGGTVANLQWSAVFRARRHTAKTFRLGRCFLAGDAAHIFSAAGAQGMNTGLQDAMNLGWKLGGVIRGWLSPAVLDSYDRERRPEVERVSLNTSRQTRWGLLRNPAKIITRNAAVRLAAWTGVMQRMGTPLISQTDVTYGTPPPAVERWRRMPALRPGMRIPAFAGDDLGRFPTIASDRFTVLLWPGDQPVSQQWSRTCQEIKAAVPAEVASVRPSSGALVARQLGRRPAAVVVRPDGHVSAVERRVEPEAVCAALREASAVWTPATPLVREGAVR